MRERAHEAEAVPAQREQDRKQADLPESAPFVREARRRSVGDGDTEDEYGDPECSDEVRESHGDEREDRDGKPERGRSAKVAKGRGDAEKRERHRQHVRTLAIFDERDETPGRRNERSREPCSVGPYRRENVCERGKQKERSRGKKGRTARAGQLACREVQRGQPERVAGRGDDPIRLGDVATDLSE